MKAEKARLRSDDLAVVDAVYARALDAEHIPGLVAGVFRDGRLEHVAALGFADLETRAPANGTTAFRIASMTKHVTALGVLMLRDEGRVSLEAPAADYVPEAAEALTPPTADSRPVSVRDLLTHMGGFVTDDPWADRMLGIAPEAFSRLLTGGGLFARPPGIAFEYSNLGYALLGRVISNVSGEGFAAFLDRRLFRPLGMASTGFDYFAAPPSSRATGYRWSEGRWAAEAAEPPGEFGAMGGLVTNAEDFARWTAFILSAWPPRDDPDHGPAPRATVRELALAHAPPSWVEARTVDGAPRLLTNAYGYGLLSGWDDLLGRYLHHSGGLPGFGSHVLYSPETGLGLFAFANRTYAPMGPTVWRAAVALHQAGLWRARPVPLDPRLARAAEAVRIAYNAGAIKSAAPLLAVNLLPDEPARLRDAEMSRRRATSGPAAAVRVEPRHALAGRLTLSCARGDVAADIALAPGPEPRIQRLRFLDG